MDNPVSDPPAPDVSVPADGSVRRRRLLQRQIAVFGWSAVVMLVLMVVALPFAGGLVELPFGNSFASAPKQEKNLPPCPPPGPPVPLRDIEVNIFNGSARTGLAKETATRLESHGIKVAKTDNFTQGEYIGTVRLQAGPGGVGAAYALGRVLPGSSVRLTTRPDKVVEVVLGGDFSGALASGEVAPADLTQPITPPAKCQTTDAP